MAPQQDRAALRQDQLPSLIKQVIIDRFHVAAGVFLTSNTGKTSPVEPLRYYWIIGKQQHIKQTKIDGLRLGHWGFANFLSWLRDSLYV